MKKVVGLFALFVLASCASDEPKAPEQPVVPEPEVRTDGLICPQVVILREADTIVDYGRALEDDANLVAAAKLIKVSGDCAYRKGNGGSGIDIAFTLEGRAIRGPALGGNEISFPYVVAIVTPSDDIVSRQRLTAKFTFDGKTKGTELEEPLHVFIPLDVKKLSLGPDYRVLVGFKQPKL